MRALSLALVHHPVLDRQGEVVTTAITNLDLHDIARSARAHGVDAFYVTHPVAAQRELAQRVRAHWVGGSGAQRIPDRAPALELLTIVETLPEALAAASAAAGAPAELWVTSARSGPDRTGYGAARALLAGEGPPVVLAFGTGWGLADTASAAVRLAPILGGAPDGYNHLSVRAAAAISLDRLRGRPG